MKKIIRIIAVALCVAILGVMLCSCQYLEDKKHDRAVFADDSKECIEFRGYTYKRISLPADVVIMDGDSYYGYQAFVSTKDVPVLLNSIYGQPITFDFSEENPPILQCYKEDKNVSNDATERFVRFSYTYTYNYFGYELDSDKCYVREDRYDELKEELQNAILDHYYYYDYHEEEYNDVYYEDRSMVELKLVDDDLTKSINETLKSGKTIDYTTLKDSDSWNSYWLSYCDKNKLVKDDSKELRIFYNSTNDKYYLLQTSYSLANHKELIEVPKSDNQLFKKLFDEQKDEVTFDDDLYFYFEDDMMDYESGESDTDNIKF